MPNPMLAAADWTMVAAVVQALATVVLLFITWRYVQLTRESVKHSAELVAQAKAQVDAIVQVHESEREGRRRLAMQALTLELQEIQVCGVGLVDAPEPHRLPTAAWDMFRGELGSLDHETIGRLCVVYKDVRRCNGHYDAWVNPAHRNDQPGHGERWRTAAKEAFEDAGRAIKMLRGESDEE
jgi:hypothetical protein